MTVFLDSTPLGLLTHPSNSTLVDACNEWLDAILCTSGWSVVVPEVIDYELRRVLIKNNRVKSLPRLDALNLKLIYLPITTEAVRRAAEYWAEARQLGIPTASEESLDADVILAGQVITYRASEYIVATSNAAHLGRFVNAGEWLDIKA